MSWIIGDGHVHIHPQHSLTEMLQAALSNFRATERSAALTGPVTRFLFLTESSGANGFAICKELGQQQDALGEFSLRETSEANTLQARNRHGEGIFLVAGRQIVTQEALEVLALGYAHAYEDGQPIHRVLTELSTQECVCVLPWGAGKWLGKRGAVIERIVRDAQFPSLFLGDNSNRPFFWPLPKVFTVADQAGLRNLPGSDPLPFPKQEEKTGSFGFYTPGTILPEQPFASMRSLLLNPHSRLTPFGKNETLIPFFKHQLSMQLGKKK